MVDSKVEVKYIGQLEGHNGWVTSLTCGVDANGKPLLVSGSRDRTLIVWKLDLDNPEMINPEDQSVDKEYKVGKPFKSLKGHSHFVSSVAISRDSKHVVSGSWDKTLRLWDLNTMTTRKLFTGHTKDVLSVAFSQDNRMILSGGMDKTLRFWNTLGDNKFTSNQFNGWVSSICNVKQGKDSILAIGSWDNKVRIFDNELSFNRGIENSDYAVVGINSDDDGEYLFVGHKNGSVKIWNLAGENNESDTLKQTLEINADLNAISFESTYFTLISLATSKGLSIREIKGNNEIFGKSYGNNVSCLSLAWDQNKNHLFAGFSDGVIRVYRFDRLE
jgi:guanine nucleotide-binding protein subunit beta-2-like 1 protein